MPQLRTTRLALTALLVSLVVTLGCASKPQPKSRGLTRITETGVLRVGMSGEQPPLNMTARSGELIGLDVALVKVLAQSMGVRAELVQAPFGQLLDKLDAGDVDIVMSGMAITPERSTRVAMVGPYYTSGKALLTKSESLAAVQLAEDLNSPRLSFAALEGSTSETFARNSLPEAKTVLVEHVDGGIEKVLAGEVDGMVTDKETAHFAILRHPDAGLHMSANTFTVEPMGIAVPQDQPHLANLLQSYLTALSNTGTLERVRKFWFKDPSWVKDLR